MSNWNRIFKPIVVLCVICIVVTGALAATNQATDPIIKEAIRVAEEKARAELLPEADGFTPVAGVKVENVAAIYTADNGVGTVITAMGKGYGGKVVVMVAFDAEDNIKQIKVTQQAETMGIGSNVVANPDYWTNYVGLSAAQPLVLNQDVNAYSGATISSKAVLSAVNAAIDAYNQIP